MDRELEVIRGEMEETRTNLTGKLEALETHVRETVASASETVSSTVEGVKETVESVSDTVETVTGTVESVTESVAESLNLSKQIEQNPWLAMGVAVGVGYLVAQVIGGLEARAHHPSAPPPPAPPQPTPPTPARSSEEEPEEDQSGTMSAAINGLSGLAIGTLMGVVREVAINALPPEWKSELSQTIDQVTANLGGKPLQAESRKGSSESKPKESSSPKTREERPREHKGQPEGIKRNGRNFARMD